MNLYKLISINIILFIVFQLNGQNNNSIISINNYDIIYKNIPTIFNISHKKNISVEVNKGNIIKISPSLYQLTVNDTGKTTITIKYKSKTIETKIYQTIELPIPQAHICGKNGITAQINDLEKISVKSHLPFDMNYQIISYNISYLENDIYNEKIINGNIFTKEAKEFMNSTYVGNKIFINDIICLSKDGTKTILPGISLIKDGPIGMIIIQNNNSTKEIIKEGYFNPKKETIKNICICNYSKLQKSKECKIESFCIMYSDGLNCKEITTNNSSLNNELSKILSNLDHGTKITFSKFIAKDKSGNAIQIPDINLTIHYL